VNVRKALITAAGRSQRALPLQTVVDRDGEEKSVLYMLVEQALNAGIDDVGVVVWPGDEDRYGQAIGPHASRVRFIAQPRPLGYGFAVLAGRGFTAGEPFLHLVGDHLYVGPQAGACASLLLQVAQSERCSISAVQPTRETLLPIYGTVGGRRLPGSTRAYRIETVVEKPTPTEAEQKLAIPGLRAGYYLCFFGIHVFTPAVMDILDGLHAARPGTPISLSEALAELARREQYLAIEVPGRRYDIGSKYGLLVAQLAVAFSGPDRSEILARVLELVADSEAGAAAGSAR
jgi:UTP--glucose-1-phosphate uridylyltransferase